MSKGQSRDEIIRIAADAGARAGLDAYEKEKHRDIGERADRRLRNTKLLLRNYRMFKDHCASAVYEVEQIDESAMDILDLMSSGGGGGALTIESIKTSVARTVTIVQHIDVMLQLYDVYCQRAGVPEEERRYRVVKRLYIDEKPGTIAEVATSENITERTVYKDVDSACEKIAALIFGIDGIRKGQ
ncbi:MAG: hypothetical protein RSB39_07795 [Oscillospiraceae bacterium]